MPYFYYSMIETEHWNFPHLQYMVDNIFLTLITNIKYQEDASIKENM